MAGSECCSVWRERDGTFCIFDEILLSSRACDDGGAGAAAGGGEEARSERRVLVKVGES